ncbi:MAG: ShlB/FhaC/HecB family hemolysin secretion/activation protein [Desulfobulbus sp.]|nr:ShlB/FhaC/HecB family hemolysin secretion/activation protein [Desulfobulbus sp.]
MPAMPAMPAAPAGFRLNGVRLSGAQALDTAELDALTAPYINRNVTLADLETLAQQIGQKYRERGYFLAQAVVPVQNVKNGIVEISVIEGRLGRITINVAPDAPVSESVVRAFLAPLQEGQALNGPQYERAMLLLSDLPGILVSSSLEEGTQTGTTDLTVNVTAARRFTFSADADNQGTKETGRYRAGGSVRWASPLSLGDNLDARLMISNNSDLKFGRISYEAPLGADGLRGSIGYSRVDYQIGGDFANLDPYGTADIIDASLSYPLIRSRRQNLFLRLSAENKSLKDNYRAIDFSAKKRVDGLSLGWTWELRDNLLGGGYTATSGIWYHGRLDIRDDFSKNADQGPTGRNTQGEFDKYTLQASRLQRIVDRHSLYLSLGGQWSGGNLDASEKLSLGGARGVRAYSSGEALVDEGVIGTAEWRWTIDSALTPFLFYDAGWGRLSKDPLPGESGNRQTLRGAGLGLEWVQAGNFSINATVAWRAGTRAGRTDGGDRNPRLFLQLQKVF